MFHEPGASTRVFPAALIVDDEPSVLKVHSRVLVRSFEVVAVATAEAALELIESGAFFDVIFCDYSLPGMSGRELFMHLREAYPAQAARLTILSGALEPGRTDAFMQALDHRWLEKPVHPAELLLLATSLAHSDAS